MELLLMGYPYTQRSVCVSALTRDSSYTRGINAKTTTGQCTESKKRQHAQPKWDIHVTPSPSRIRDLSGRGTERV